MHNDVQMVTLDRANEIIFGIQGLGEGHVFGVEFIKRTNGELRQMNARFGVYSHTVGGYLKYVPEAKNLIGVFDMEAPPDRRDTKGAYRMIDLNSVLSVTYGGVKFEVR